MACRPGFIESLCTPRNAGPVIGALGGVRPGNRFEPCCVPVADEGGGLLGAALEALPLTIATVVGGLTAGPVGFLAPSAASFVGAAGRAADVDPGTVQAVTTAARVAAGSFDSGGLTMSNGFDFFGDIFSSFDVGGFAQSLVSEVGLPLLAQELVASPQPMAIPVAASASRALQSIGTAITGTAALGVVGGGMLVARQAVQAILQKIAINKFLARVPSLDSIVAVAKKALPFIGQAAVAAGLAITIEELSTLLLAHATRKRRRMNPGNVKALRRSMRRLESFHKLCGKADMLRSRRRSPGRKGCKDGGVIVRQG